MLNSKTFVYNCLLLAIVATLFETYFKVNTLYSITSFSDVYSLQNEMIKVFLEQNTLSCVSILNKIHSL